MLANPVRGVICSVLFLVAQAGWAQGWPTKPLRLVVPYPPGGPVDVSARLIGAKLGEGLGQPVVVDNRPGAGGNIGADHVAKSPPDGYTLLMGAIATHAINPSLYPNFPYDPIADFRHVAMVVQVPNILVVHPEVPARDVKALIALAKERPGRLDFASGSTGSTGHLAGELFKQMTGTFMVHIPYRGAAPAVADLLGGRVHLMFDNLASALPNLRSGKVRALAVTTVRRSESLPDVPTLHEAGLKGFDLSTWWGVMAPAKVPEAVIERLAAELARAMEASEVADRLRAMGAEPTAIRTPAQFTAFVERERKTYAEVVKRSGARVD